MRGPRLPLQGIRVIEMTLYRAMPHCAMTMAALGAEVIKVESMMRVDITRLDRALPRTPPGEFPEPAALDRSTRFTSMNLGKQSVRLNLKSEEGRAALRRLVQISDMVITGYTPGVLDRLGIGYEALRRLRPDLIMVSLSGFGQQGPQGHFRSMAPVFAASGGLCHLSGYRDGPPMEFIGSMDNTVGTPAIMAALAALAERHRTGRGQHVDLSGSEAITAFIGSPVMEHLLNGAVPMRDGNRRAHLAPSNCYRCKGEDEWISIAIATDQEWQSLCRVIGRADAAADPRFATHEARKANEEEADRIIEAWTVERTAYEAMHLLQSAGVAAIPSFREDQLLHDPHLKDRGGWFTVEHPLQGRLRELRLPWVFAEAETAYATAPLLGQHTVPICADLLGLPPPEVARLQDARAFF